MGKQFTWACLGLLAWSDAQAADIAITENEIHACAFGQYGVEGQFEILGQRLLLGYQGESYILEFSSEQGTLEKLENNETAVEELEQRIQKNSRAKTPSFSHPPFSYEGRYSLVVNEYLKRDLLHLFKEMKETSRIGISFDIPKQMPITFFYQESLKFRRLPEDLPNLGQNPWVLAAAYTWVFGAFAGTLSACAYLISAIVAGP